MKQTQNTLLPPAGAVPAKRSGAAQLALNEKIINILEARAIQKRNIESDKLEREIYDDNLERKSKPVVQAIKANAAFETKKPAIQMQGNNLPGARLLEQQMPPPQAAAQVHPSLTQARALPAAQARAAESTATSATTPGEEPWIQKLYRKYRNSTKCKTTQFEIAEKGVLGLYGQVDVRFSSPRERGRVDKAAEASALSGRARVRSRVGANKKRTLIGAQTFYFFVFHVE